MIWCRDGRDVRSNGRGYRALRDSYWCGVEEQELVGELINAFKLKTTGRYEREYLTVRYRYFDQFERKKRDG